MRAWLVACVLAASAPAEAGELRSPEAGPMHGEGPGVGVRKGKAKGDKAKKRERKGKKAGKGKPGTGLGAGKGPKAAALEEKLTPEQLAERKRAASLRRGNLLLSQGRYRLAVEAFTTLIDHDPDNAEAHIGLGIARARLGRCLPALDEFLHWDFSFAFGTRAASLAAGCAEEAHDYPTALDYALLAQNRRPSDRTALTRVVLDADRAGERVVRDVAYEYLWYVNPAQDESLFADAVLSLRTGDLDSFFTTAALWRREGRSTAELLRLEAQAWLYLGDPEEARSTMLETRRLRRGNEARETLAEATRRAGYPGDALAVLDNKFTNHLSGPDADAIRARILVDEGDVAGAEKLLAEGPGADTTNQIAARWYVARAKGDTATMAELEAVFLEARECPLEAIEQYIPIVNVSHG